MFFGIELILKDTQTPLEQACIFGDRLNTDILAGNRAGITSILVLTGVTTKEEVESLNIKAKQTKDFDKNILPDIMINNLNEIFKNPQGN